MNISPTDVQKTLGLIDADILDLREILQVVRRRWIVIVGVTILTIAAALLLTVNTTKLYTATSLVLIENRENRVVDFEAVLSGLPADSATIDSQVEILKSQALATRVVRDLNLIEDPEFNSALDTGGSGLLGWLNPLNWLRAILPSDRLLLDDNELAEQASIAVVIAVQDRMRVRRRGLTYVIEIGFTSDSPVKAARIANAIADLYIVDQLEARFEATRRANDWLSERLQGLRDQVRIAETAAASFAADNNLMSSGGATVTEQQLSEINQQLISARAELSSAEASYDRVRQIVAAGGNIESISQVVQSPAILQLRGQQSSLRREEAELAGRYGDRHPDLIDIRQRMREVDQQLQSEMERIVNALGNEVEVARNREQSLEASLSRVTVDQARNNRAMIRLRELERTAESQRTLYETFLARFNETRQEEGLQTSDARVIAQATRPLDASHPKASLNLALGGVLGLFTGFGLAFLIEWLDQGLRTRDQVEGFLGLPQISAIPLLTKTALTVDGQLLSPEELVALKPLSTFTAALQSLRAAIDLSDVDEPPKTVLMTSALPNEGKTTTALSLARMAAMSGQKTLLIDADLRHPSLEHLVDLDRAQKKVGLVDVLANESPLKNALQKDTLTNLYLIFSGKRASNPTDLLKSDRMRELLKEVRDHFDLVILDAAPILPVVDSRILARIVDTTVFVVRWQETPRDAARDAIRNLRDFDATIAGIALSQVDLARQRRYGYGGSYYYYGRYREYYSD